MRRKAVWKPILVVATALVVGSIAVEKLAVTALAPPTASATATVNAPPAPTRGATASTAQAPAAEPVLTRADIEPPPRAPTPPAPNRALCSTASEAAGLCKPQ